MSNEEPIDLWSMNSNRAKPEKENRTVISQLKPYEEVDIVINSAAVPKTRNQVAKMKIINQEKSRHNREHEILHAIAEG